MAPKRSYSLAYLTAHTCTPPQALQLAAELGYAEVGLRLQPNAPGAPQQYLIGLPEVLRETQAVQRDTGVGVFDLEIIRIGEAFDLEFYRALFEAGAALNAKAMLVAGDDTHEPRLADNYARLCEALAPYGITADLEFMPWTAVPDAKARCAWCRRRACRPTRASWWMRCTSAAVTPRWTTSAPSRASCCTTRRCAMPWPAPISAPRP